MAKDRHIDCTTKVVGIGAGGHSKVVIEILLERPDIKIVGLLDTNPSLFDAEVMGIPVLGDDSVLPELFARGVTHAFLGVGAITDMSVRKRLHNSVLGHGMELLTVIHRAAHVSISSRIGRGVMLGAGAIVNVDAVLGDSVIVNTGAIVEHDCAVGSYVHVASGAVLAGGVEVGDGTFVGAGSVVLQCVRIGSGVVIGAGSVVTRDVEDGMTVMGVPARVQGKCASACGRDLGSVRRPRESVTVVR